MNKYSKSKRVFIRPRDRELFRFLFENKGATFKQILNYVFKTNKSRYPYRRLAEHIKIGYVKTTLNGHQSGKIIYYLSPKGFLKFISSDEKMETIQLKSDCEAHDLLLIDCREVLQKIDIVDQYYSENMIQSGFYCGELKKVKSEISLINPDAIVFLKENSDEAIVAIELETNNKGLKRYERLFRKYHHCQNLQLVFYICKDEKLKSKLMEYQKNMSANTEDKILYTTVKNVLESNNQIDFERVNGKKSCLKLKIDTQMHVHEEVLPPT